MRASYAFVLQKNNAEVSTYSVLTPTFIIEPEKAMEKSMAFLLFKRTDHIFSRLFYEIIKELFGEVVGGIHFFRMKLIGL